MSVQIVNEEALLLLRIVVKPGLDTRQDVIWLKADDIVQEASELVRLGFYLNSRPSILAHKFDVRMHLRFKILHSPLNFVDQMLLFEDVKILLALVQPCLRLNAVVDVLLEVFHLIKRACGEVL